MESVERGDHNGGATLEASHQFVSEAEQLVWERLGKHVSADTVLIPNLRLTNEKKDYELDIVAGSSRPTPAGRTSTAG
ncbi:hypothetical protein OO014_15910 [Intrasporangium calvum]|uniref:Uncharacterized protein n=1 Tax=Intrasporangium calvum TaxID=53358 RepID=A0ABT5GL52_9MICO|nr:hypothetical protein [Intrasporangium calvum]MDC5698741.1 hypothetical protein [Intrasporangium calvum]